MNMNIYGDFQICISVPLKHHFLREISRITKYLIHREAKVAVKLSATHFRRSPLFQESLNLPCEVIVTMLRSVKDQILIQQYQQMGNELYRQPKEEI